MRNRLVKLRPHSKEIAGFPIHQDGGQGGNLASARSSTDTGQGAPSQPEKTILIRPPRPQHPPEASGRSTLTLASEGTINAAMSRAPTHGTGRKPLPSIPVYLQQPQLPVRSNTIRTVTSFDDRPRHSDDSSADDTSSPSASRNSGFSSSLNSNASMSSASQDATPTQNGSRKVSGGGARSRGSPAIQQDGFLDVPRTVSARSSVEIPQRESSLSATSGLSSTVYANAEPPPGGGVGATDASAHAAGEAHFSSSNGWDSTVGKAGLGKTGRVINRLVSDNEALKRDIHIERLRAEESKQAVKVLEDKLEQTISHYESRLLEANVNKALLVRKERQVETLQASVELERKRAADAREREQMWKDEMEKVRAEAARKTDEATNYAALMEGRYNAISSHWRDQGEEVKKAMGEMKARIGQLLEERRRDDDRIETLRELCDQQDGNIRELREQKERIAAQFERYKEEQEGSLREIKTKAREREEEQERTLAESKAVLDKLRWALNVKDKVEWAQ
ncbi:hypothetical protein QBC47DRAFT_383025 [Echria macrotheca]|uniref:SWI5-dependent HO expression protein 3 n=1 Tax=Echria macrotheca TaxID=438768 RepID=A0AAJ0BDP6_9PEZI|nr:hypothetical protein QBC47DRAFT_383025 [Echria macrotheca]